MLSECSVAPAGRAASAAAGSSAAPWRCGARTRSSALARALAAAVGQAIGQHGGVHRAGAGRADALDGDALVLEQAVEHAPGEGAVRAAALQRQVDGLDRRAGVALAAASRSSSARSWLSVPSAQRRSWLPPLSVQRSVRRPAAIDRERRAGDRRGRVAAQERRKRAHLLDRGELLVRLLRPAARRGSPPRARCRAPWPGRRSASRPAASRHSRGRSRCR